MFLTEREIPFIQHYLHHSVAAGGWEGSLVFLILHPLLESYIYWVFFIIMTHYASWFWSLDFMWFCRPVLEVGWFYFHFTGEEAIILRGIYLILSGAERAEHGFKTSFVCFVSLWSLEVWLLDFSFFYHLKFYKKLKWGKETQREKGKYCLIKPVFWLFI